jgi:hypothetical protein
VTIDPRIGMWISIIAAIILFLASATTQLTDVFGPAVAQTISSVCVLLGGIISAVNAVLHMIPAQKGPLGAAQFPLGPK